MFLKDETERPEARKDIRLAVADHALGPYVLGPEPISKENWVEGPTAFRAGQEMIVLFDAYRRKQYEGVKSRDLKTWTGLGAELQMPPGARHGTVCRGAGEDPEGAARGRSRPPARRLRRRTEWSDDEDATSLVSLTPLVLIAVLAAAAFSGGMRPAFRARPRAGTPPRRSTPSRRFSGATSARRRRPAACRCLSACRATSTRCMSPAPWAGSSRRRMAASRGRPSSTTSRWCRLAPSPSRPPTPM